MKYWTTVPVAICAPMLLVGCMSSASNVQTEAVAPAAKAAPAAMAKAAPAMAKKATMSKMSASCNATKALSFASATDDGTNDGHGPKNAIDGNMDSDSRWSSKGTPKTLNLKLSSVQKIGAVGVAWYKGDERQSKFAIETSKDGKTFTKAVASRSSSGSNGGLEQYKFAPVDAQYVRIIGNGNASSTWNSVVEAKAYGC